MEAHQLHQQHHSSSVGGIAPPFCHAVPPSALARGRRAAPPLYPAARNKDQQEAGRDENQRGTQLG